jgi:hypothetical protein
MAESRSLSVKSGITALAGGANSAATPVLDGDINIIAVAATAADSVRLPANQPKGSSLVVRNNGAASANVFPNTGATINGGAADAAGAVASAKSSIAYQVADNGLTWITVAGA